MKISYNTFSGMRPALASHLLPASGAQVANNCKFVRGDLRSFRAPLAVQALALASVKSIFQYTENGNTHWVESANDVDAIGSPAPNDPYERMFFTGESEPRFFANDNISVAGFDPDTDYYKLGIPAPTTAPTVNRAGGAGSDYRAYFYCYLNHYGDVGSNSAEGTISDYDSGRILLTTIATAPTGRAIDRVWVYRTNSSTAGTGAFQFVLEAFFFDAAESYAAGDFVVYGNQIYECTTAHTGAWDAGHFTAGEAVADADLGSVFAYSDYYPAPDGAAGLIVLANGVCACFYGNTLYLSEPLKPWAFPYQKSFLSDIVGIAKSGTSVMVCTTAAPVRVYGQHPSAMAVYEYADVLPCEAKRSICAWQNMVFYRSKNGLVAVNSERAWVFTADDGELAAIIDADIWQSDYAPLHARIFKGLYFGFSSAGSFYIDLTGRYCGFFDIIGQAACVSANNLDLFIAAEIGSTVYVQKWEGDAQNYLPFTWRGRLELLNYETNLAVALVLLDAEFLDAIGSLVDLLALNATIFSGDVHGALRDNTLRSVTLRGCDLYALSGFAISGAVSFKLYVDGVLKFATALSAAKNYFTLPAGWLSRRIEIELSGYTPTLRCIAASSTEEVMGRGDN